MYTKYLVPALFAAAAMAGPMVKKDIVYDVVVVTATDFVYPDGSQVSPTPAANVVEETPAPVVVSTPAYTPAPAAPAAVTVVPAAANNAAGSAPTTIIPNLQPSDPEYAAIAVAQHNVHRSNHTAGPVTYNSTLAQWAQQKANTCVFDESVPAGAQGGMNIAQGTDLSASYIAATISNLWYNSEFNNYDPSWWGQNDVDVYTAAFEGFGHLTQVIWAGTQQIGCGTSACNGGYFTACFYYPAGNYVGDFSQVHAPEGHPTVGVVGDTIVGM